MSDDNFFVALVYRGMGNEMHDANAALIASAPTLAARLAEAERQRDALITTVRGLIRAFARFDSGYGPDLFHELADAFVEEYGKEATDARD